MRLLLAALVLCLPTAAGADETYVSPQDVGYLPNGKMLAVADRTGRTLLLIPVTARGLTGKGAEQVALKGEPLALWCAKGTVYVAEYGAGTVAEINVAAGTVARRLPAGRYPTDIAVTPKLGRRLLVTNSGLGTLSVIVMKTGKASAQIPVGRWPSAVAITPDDSLAIVGNMLPPGASDNPQAAVEMSLIDLKTLKRSATIPLPAGSAAVRDIVVSPDGRWAYAGHIVGRTNLPTTQLDRGWVATNAITIIDLAARKHYTTVLLDSPSQGASNPWGLATSADGKTLWVALSGIHQVARIDLAGLHAMLAKRPAGKRAALVNDLAALYRTNLITRIDLGQLGPRGLAMSPDGKRLAAATYFSESVSVLDTATGKVLREGIAFGGARKKDPVRRGELLFFDARMSFQNWLSCGTCHPGARSDGLNWDLLNDGLGNPKNTKSLLWSHRTPPVMSTSVRDRAETAVRAGIRHIQFVVRPEADAKAIDAYLKSLTPLPSPYRVDDKPSEAALRGKAIFDDKQVACATCHPAPLYTNLKRFDVGTQGTLDRTAKFDTPTLVELWRTGPYLHDGSAATLKDALTTHNKADKHGKTSHLTAQQIADLVEYLNSL